MAYAICKIKNLTGSIGTLNGHEFAVDEIYTVQDSARLSWASNDEVLAAIAAEDYEIHDANGAVSGISNQIDLLKLDSPTTVTPTAPKNEYDLKPYGAVHKHINASSMISEITLSNKSGNSYDYSCAVTPAFYDCICDATAETIDGVLSEESGSIETFYGRHANGVLKLCKPVDIDFQVGDNEHDIWQLWGAHVDFADYGDDDLVRLQIVDDSGVGIALGLYTLEEFEAAGSEVVIKEYDECFVRQLAKINMLKTPDGAPGTIYAGLKLRAKYYPKDIAKTDIKCWIDYILTVKE